MHLPQLRLPATLKTAILAIIIIIINETVNHNVCCDIIMGIKYKAKS